MNQLWFSEFRDFDIIVYLICGDDWRGFLSLTNFELVNLWYVVLCSIWSGLSVLCIEGHCTTLAPLGHHPNFKFTFFCFLLTH